MYRILGLILMFAGLFFAYRYWSGSKERTMDEIAEDDPLLAADLEQFTKDGNVYALRIKDGYAEVSFTKAPDGKKTLMALARWEMLENNNTTWRSKQKIGE